MYLSIISHPLLEAVGAALVHSLWQGALVAGVLYLTLRVCTSADVRYALSGAALALMFLLPVSTGMQIYLQNRSSPAFYPTLENVTVATASPRVGVSPLSSEESVTAATTQHPV